MDVDTLRQHVSRRLVVGGIDHREEAARGACRGFLGGDQVADHVVGLGHALDFLDRGQLDEFLVGAGGREAQRADALGDDVQRVPLLGVLRHEHVVQAVELRAGDVPVEIVRHQVQRVAVGEQGGQAFGNLLAVGIADADVDGRAFRFLGCHSKFSYQTGAGG